MVRLYGPILGFFIRNSSKITRPIVVNDIRLNFGLAIGFDLSVVKKDTQQKKKKYNQPYDKDDGNTHCLDICLI